MKQLVVSHVVAVIVGVSIAGMVGWQQDRAAHAENTMALMQELREYKPDTTAADAAGFVFCVDPLGYGYCVQQDGTTYPARVPLKNNDSVYVNFRAPNLTGSIRGIGAAIPLVRAMVEADKAAPAQDETPLDAVMRRKPTPSEEGKK